MDSDSSRVRFKESLLFVLFDDMGAYLFWNAWMLLATWSFVPDVMVAISQGRAWERASFSMGHAPFGPIF
jgi:hypothetical protein